MTGIPPLLTLPHPHRCYVGLTCTSPCRRLGIEDEFEREGGERRSDVVQSSDVPLLGAPRSGTLSVTFLCEERAVECERKVTSRRLSGEHCGLIGV